jgi:hypothetical protein
VWMRTCRYTPRGYVHTTYSSDEIDAIAAYCPELNKCYFLPASMVSGQTALYMRLAPARNGQTEGVKWAAEYELGAIAQLGERVTGSHEAAGSSPASST